MAGPMRLPLIKRQGGAVLRVTTKVGLRDAKVEPKAGRLRERTSWTRDTLRPCADKSEGIRVSEIDRSPDQGNRNIHAAAKKNDVPEETQRGLQGDEARTRRRRTVEQPTAGAGGRMDTEICGRLSSRLLAEGSEARPMRNRRGGEG